MHETERLGGKVFQRDWFKIVDDYPRDAKFVRFWDLASTEVKPGRDPDFTAGPKVAMKGGQYWIIDMPHFRLSPGQAESEIKYITNLDSIEVQTYIEQEPGSSGKYLINHFQVDVLPGRAVYGFPSTGSKEHYATVLSSAAEANNVFLVRGEWNRAFLNEAVDFPMGTHDDQIDAASKAVVVFGKEVPIIAPMGGGHTSRWRM
jgi:predicted phage terminase large subunit-like protein